MKAEKISVLVARKAIEAQDIATFELVAMSGGSLPACGPGAHVDVCVAGLVRQYSLCNGPEDHDRYLIAVKKEPRSRGASRAMHEEVNEGDILSISAPRNNFPLVTRTGHSVLVAGGIGVTPILSMARHLRAANASFELHYFVRSPAYCAFKDSLSSGEFRDKVTFHYALEGEQQRATLELVLKQRSADDQLYLCGPHPFMTLVKTIAAPHWPSESVHLEYFSADLDSIEGQDDAFEIELATSGAKYIVPIGKTIVEVLAENGISVDTSCEQGVCGTCVLGVREGVPDHRDAFFSPEEQRTGDRILPCVSRSRSQTLLLDI